MKYIFQFARILAFCLLGELLHALLPLPIPASLYGLVLLLAALLSGLVKLEQVKQAGNFLTGLFTLLFVPAAVGVMELVDVLTQSWLPILIAIVLVTAIVMGVSGKVTQWILRRKK